MPENSNTPETTSSDTIRHIAWTGGYDSTYLLITALASGNKVQPIFLACRCDGRRSQGQEWDTVQSLHPILDARYPGLLLPLQIVTRIAPEALQRAQARILSANQLLPIRHRISGQYEALVGYAEMVGHPIEVAAEKGGGLEWIVTQSGIPDEILTSALSGMILPLLDVSREIMQNAARLGNYTDLLAYTWSCRHPKDGHPCNECTSCKSRPLPYSQPPSDPTDKIDVSVVLSAWGDASTSPQVALASRVLRQVGKAIRESGIKAEIIVTSPSIEAKHRPDGIPCTVIVDDSLTGNLGRSRNAGASIASGRHVLFLDSDVLVSAEALTRMLESSQAGKCCMPIVYSLHQEPNRDGCWRGTIPDMANPGGTGSCGIAMMPRWMWAWTQGWPETIGWGREDQDFRRNILTQWEVARWPEGGLVHLHHPADPKSPGLPGARWPAAPMPSETRRLIAKPGKPRHDKPRALLLADVEGWAFDKNCKDIKRAISPKIDSDIVYIRPLTLGQTPWPNLNDYDVILECFPWLQTKGLLPRNKTIGALWHTYLHFDEQPVEPGKREFDRAKVNATWLVCNDNLRRWYEGDVPQTRYLTIPIDLSRHPEQVSDFASVRPCWAGNGRRGWEWNPDPKGITSIIKPTCQSLGLDLRCADYHQNRIQPDDMPAWYLQSNTYLCLSSDEGCSNAVSEALASGQVIISTDVGHIREVQQSQIEHYGSTGIIIIERSQEALIQALADLSNLSPDERAEKGRINRDEVSKRWSWDQWADKYRDVILSVVNNGAK